MRAPGWGRLTAGCVLGVVVLGAVGVPVLGPTGAPAGHTRAGADAPTIRALTAADVVLRVRAEPDDTSRSSRVAAPGSVEGLTSAPTAASVLPPGLTGPPGSTGPLGVPDRVLAAYHSADVLLARTRPGCAMPWWLLAGIGKVESGHASGGRVDRDGRTRGEVLGPLLDGSLAGTMVITDTDRGVMDGDAAFDRAVGPMQFLPGTWRGVGTDADRDGTADPHDVDDAAATAGVYLCRGGGTMADPEQMRAAVLRYNGSDEYADAVITWGTSYRDRAVAVPGQDGTIGPAPVVPAPSAPGTPTAPPTTAPPTSHPTAPPTTTSPTSHPTAPSTTEPPVEPTEPPGAAPEPPEPTP